MILPKIEIKKILYATDLSENARVAFAYAASLASLYNAGITILHVITESPSLESGIAGYVGEDRWEQIKQKHIENARAALIGKKRDNVAIKEVLNLFCEEVKEKNENQSFVTDEVIVTRGNAVEQIVKVAEERNCDLIIMGKHGHGTLADAMMGSTAQRVLRRSKKPVLVVRLPDED